MTFVDPWRIYVLILVSFNFISTRNNSSGIENDADETVTNLLVLSRITCLKLLGSWSGLSKCALHLVALFKPRSSSCSRDQSISLLEDDFVPRHKQTMHSYLPSFLLGSLPLPTPPVTRKPARS